MKQEETKIIGMKVWWKDPDGGASSGWYEISSIYGLDNDDEVRKELREFGLEDATISIDNEYSSAEVFFSELYTSKGSRKHPKITY